MTVLLTGAAGFIGFHVARALLEDAGFSVPASDRAHGYLWLRLANSGHPDVRVAGNHLQALRSKRNWADYDIDRPMPHHFASGEIRLAETIMETLETAAAEPVIRARIVDAIKVYERDVLRDVTWQA